jgi:alanine dehydrogenase
VIALASKGWKKALRDDAALALGLNAHEGLVTNAGVAQAFPALATATVESVVA